MAEQESPPPGDPRVGELHAVLQLVRPLGHHLGRAVEDRLDGTGISVSSWAMLERLAADGPLTVPLLGRALAFPRQVTQRMVDELLALRLVEPRRDPGQRRSHLFALAPAGRQALDDVRSGQDADLAVLAERLTGQQTAAAVAVLTALTEHFRTAARVEVEGAGDAEAAR